MSQDVSGQRAEAHYSQPFTPFKGNVGGPDSPATLRIATAAEYIAAQMGIIARKTSEIESHLAKLVRHEDVRQAQEHVSGMMAAGLVRGPGIPGK